jgi:hypothetical protein
LYVRNAILAKWDNYIIIEEADVVDEDAMNNGINDDIDKAEYDEEDGVALAEI